jgi:hypothetical protein
MTHPDLLCPTCLNDCDLCTCAEDEAERMQDQRELDEQQFLDGEDRCLMLD